MFKHRFLIVSFIFFFFLVGSFSALASCFLENEGPAKSTGQVPGSISCLNDQEPTFLPQTNYPDKKIYFSDMEKRTGFDYYGSLFQVGLSDPTHLRPSSCIFLSLSISIYQLKTAYRI